jgi:cation diffusion facilitator CzcD-associated flavoprotein CzcO
LNPTVTQLHSAQYRNPSNLPAGPVLVVGDGNSGRQIAAELAGTRPVGGDNRAISIVVPGRTSADDGHTIMLDLGVEQRKHRVWPVGVVLLRAGTWAGADVGQSLVAVKSW